MFMIPNVSLFNDKRFKDTANKMGITLSKTMEYKAWLYTWAIWESVPVPGKIALEIGPGNKHKITKYCLDHGIRYIAVDPKPKPRGLNFPNLEYYTTSIGDGKLSKLYNTIDIIYCVSVVEHLPKKERNKFFKEVNDLLSPKGRVYLTTPPYAYSIKTHSKDYTTNNYITYQELCEYLSPIKCGEYIKIPGYKNHNIILKAPSDKNNWRTWTEYCGVFTKYE